MGQEVLWLLLAFQLKHQLADYYLQLPYMYENKGKSEGWRSPLRDHALVHAGFTLLIVFTYMLYAFGASHSMLAIFITSVFVALFDFLTHFAIDRWKATRKPGMDTKSFWVTLGWDQHHHHVVGILIVYYITQRM